MNSRGAGRGRIYFADCSNQGILRVSEAGDSGRTAQRGPCKRNAEHDCHDRPRPQIGYTSQIIEDRERRPSHARADERCVRKSRDCRLAWLPRAARPVWAGRPAKRRRRPVLVDSVPGQAAL
jgi:hypothetical protein